MRLDLIIGLLQTANLGVIGTNIFVHRMGPDCKQGILIREPLTGATVDVDLPNYFKHDIQAIIRYGDQAAGDALAMSVMKTLTFYNMIFNDANGNLLMQVNHLIPRKLPVVYPRLDGQGIEWSIDFNANYVMPI